ncbi:hypothetical protein LB553_21140 [Mesorhizobium sp. CA8]|uniref:hypothetical protein n=1 Tax=Mesorhizobium sp. CA8 TaxID=2876637 RepID=UPI001CC8F16C|nr:hypothetical protein [Mesorhizobium sp. CA8]MBZ9763368.1 hypothetical protein [Mesorhizobium sp. CA8]
MRAIQRPLAAPDGLEGVRNGKTELERARQHFGVEKKTDGFKFSAYSDPTVKQALSNVFKGLCAYCESFYDATQTQDVEHYRPKGRIDNGVQKIKPGYWWLAAKWDNLVPSCILCNRETNQILFDNTVLKSGKGDRFPLLEEAHRGTKEGSEAGETPLLIDPCNDDPGKYLRYDVRDGKCIVVPKVNNISDLNFIRARTSIDVYGLNRSGLVIDRTRYMKRIQYILRQLEKQATALDRADVGQVAHIEAEITETLEVLNSHRDGNDRFSSMARWLIDPVYERLGIA